MPEAINEVEGSFTMRHYIEPVGWLLVCLLFMALLAFAIVPLVNDRSQPARQPAFDGKVMKPSGK
jgi:hypothetical protein